MMSEKELLSQFILLLNNSINFDTIEKYCIGIVDTDYKMVLYPFMYQELHRAIFFNVERIEPLMTMTYAEYLKSPEWKHKRQILIRMYDKCQLCGRKFKTYHVHHNDYSKKPLEEIIDLIVLCEECHERFHENKRNDEQVIRLLAENMINWEEI